MKKDKKRLLSLIIAALVLMGLGGCGGKTEGSVSKLSFVPAHEGNVEVPDYTLICFSSGTMVSCYPMYMGSHMETRSYPDAWYMDLLSCNTESKCSITNKEISKHQYDTYAIGDWYPAVDKYKGIRTN